MTSGRVADPGPAVTDTLFTGGVKTGDLGRFPDLGGRWALGALCCGGTR